ncbi:hypothetical protein BS47DRAFT_1488702 [Hydnum rufescens UP504]|uniref:GED domain-containing protein n=1 Tax=Hydnum rufescens UP504 TaxID=1448309 RepID=A0A9P6ALR1_9AGAM|nr:hypothetical protein BS47DRAFT_1488702 [Hydnum rufescens UP504]
MECRLQQSEKPWESQVFLRIETDSSGRRLNQIKEAKFGPVLHDKDALELMLRRAQLAILNPSVESSKFVRLGEKEALSAADGIPPLGSKEQLAFSSNVVCIDVSGPDVADLSFIDLPGIISNVAEAKDEWNITAVKDLITRNIQGNCLILLTITMRDDLDNQSAFKLAKDTDPQGLRTIGVLTKPDTLQPGEEKGWLDVLEGGRYPLALGYYITKQRAPNELALKMSSVEARKREATFFAGTQPWNQCGLALKERMGTGSLTLNLSKLLSGLIDRTLPRIRTDVSEQRTAARQALASLPPRLTQSPSVELLKLVNEFCRELNLFVQGGPGYEGLIQKCTPAYQQFRIDIRETAPVFIAEPHKSASLARQEKTPATQNLLSFNLPPKEPATASASDTAQGATQGAAPSSKQPLTFAALASMQLGKPSPFGFTNSMNGTAVSPFSTPNPVPAGNPSSTNSASPTRPVSAQPSPSTPKRRRTEALSDCDSEDEGGYQKIATGSNRKRRRCEPMYLEELQSRIDSSITRELPFNVPFPAKVSLMLGCFRDWETLSFECFEAVCSVVENKVIELINRYFDRFSHSALKEHVKTIFQDQVQLCKQHVKGQLAWLIKLEMSPPFTQNEHYFASYRDKYLTKYKSQRPGANVVPGNAVNQEAAISLLRSWGYNIEKAQDLARLADPDPFERELIVAAEVRAYFQVAYKRVIDNIPRAIDLDFIRALGDQVQNALIDKLQIGLEEGRDRAASYVADDPRVSLGRDELEGKTARLEQISAKLLSWV